MAQDASNEEKGGKATVSMKGKRIFFCLPVREKGLPSLPPPKKGIQRGLLLLALQEHRGEHCLSPFPLLIQVSPVQSVCAVEGVALLPEIEELPPSLILRFCPGGVKGKRKRREAEFGCTEEEEDKDD